MAWLDLNGLPTHDLIADAHHLRRKIRCCTGIPASIGIAPTFTLAKLASRLAKRHGGHVHQLGDLSEPATRQVLAATPIEDVWGVGTRLAARLALMDIHSALDLACSPPHHIRRHFSVVLERTARELGGLSCLDDATGLEGGRHHLMTSRSLGQATGHYPSLAQALRQHTNRGAERLRGHARRHGNPINCASCTADGPSPSGAFDCRTWPPHRQHATTGKGSP